MNLKIYFSHLGVVVAIWAYEIFFLENAFDFSRSLFKGIPLSVSAVLLLCLLTSVEIDFESGTSIL